MKYTNKLLIAILSTSLLVSSCSDKFLKEKQDFTGVNEETFADAQLANSYVGYVYRLFQPVNNTQAFTQTQNGESGSFSDVYARASDELPGQGDWNRPWASLSIVETMANKYFGQRMSSSIANNTWTRIRQINLFLQEIDKHGLTPSVTEPLKGQMLFWRAYQYFELLRLYGGVPIVLTAENPIGQEGSTSLQVPRSKSSEVLEQIIKDLDQAKAWLPGKWTNSANDWGRITSGAAAAFKGRVLLTWASPLFNRNDDVTRWQRAYDANLEAKTLLEANGFGLFTSGGTSNATAWDNMWFTSNENPEAVIVYLFNRITTSNTQRNNGHENAARSRELTGGGSINPTKQIVDAFPMMDGKAIDDPTSKYTYSANKFYKNRDPRFYKTFAYNGSIWAHSANANFRQWTYSWYANATAATPTRFTEANPNNSGIYLKKATSASAVMGSFVNSGTDFMELRFAEVILNLAEAAVGINKLQEGLDGVKAIRQRAGVENADGDYGLSAAKGNRDKLFGAIINERKVEFAYEGKRFYDLRRWLLFNNDFGTCTRLGQKPIHGTRRTAYWIAVKTEAGANYSAAADPFKPAANGSVGIIDREPAGLSAAQMEAHIDNLYDKYFRVVERDNIDPTNPADWKFTWFNEYYFFGLNENILTTSPYLEQTKGWPGLYGVAGTFDPLL